MGVTASGSESRVFCLLLAMGVGGVGRSCTTIWLRSTNVFSHTQILCICQPTDSIYTYCLATKVVRKLINIRLIVSLLLSYAT